MGNEARKRSLARAVEAALNETDGAGRYRLSRSEASGMDVTAEERAHPLEYDRNGFPAPQRTASFGVRVRRLIGGS
jgi:hypothetical protein